MELSLLRHALVIAGLLWGSLAFPVAAKVPVQAMTATVTGANIQNVGFRAMIQKLAIQYNIAGDVRNGGAGIVVAHLQGDAERIAPILEAMRAGNKKSSSGNSVTQAPSEADPNLKTFTVYGWTSTSRHITTPYDLVFTLRPTDEVISHKAARKTWDSIALATLKGDDLERFRAHLDDPDD